MCVCVCFEWCVTEEGFPPEHFREDAADRPTPPHQRCAVSRKAKYLRSSPIQTRSKRVLERHRTRTSSSECPRQVTRSRLASLKSRRESQRESQKAQSAVRRPRPHVDGFVVLLRLAEQLGRAVPTCHHVLRQLARVVVHAPSQTAKERALSLSLSARGGSVPFPLEGYLRLKKQKKKAKTRSPRRTSHSIPETRGR